MAVMSFTIVYLGPHMLHAGVPQGSRRVPVLKKKKRKGKEKKGKYIFLSSCTNHLFSRNRGISQEILF